MNASHPPPNLATRRKRHALKCGCFCDASVLVFVAVADQIDSRPLFRFLQFAIADCRKIVCVDGVLFGAGQFGLPGAGIQLRPVGFVSRLAFGRKGLGSRRDESDRLRVDGCGCPRHGVGGAILNQAFRQQENRQNGSDFPAVVLPGSFFSGCPVSVFKERALLADGFKSSMSKKYCTLIPEKFGINDPRFSISPENTGEN